MKVVVNVCFGGFGLSKLALDKMAEWGADSDILAYGYFEDGANRAHPMLVRAVEELKRDANGEYARLQIFEMPDGTNFVIEEYDGSEHIAEAHQTWR